MSAPPIPGDKREADSFSELPPVLTIKEAAETLRCSVRTIQNLIDRGELTAFKVGRLTRINRSDIERFTEPRAD